MAKQVKMMTIDHLHISASAEASTFIFVTDKLQGVTPINCEKDVVAHCHGIT